MIIINVLCKYSSTSLLCVEFCSVFTWLPVARHFLCTNVPFQWLHNIVCMKMLITLLLLHSSGYTNVSCVFLVLFGTQQLHSSNYWLPFLVLTLIFDVHYWVLLSFWLWYPPPVLVPTSYDFKWHGSNNNEYGVSAAEKNSSKAVPI